VSVPAYVPYYIYVGAAAIIAAVLLGLRRALAEAKWPEHDRTQTVRTAAIILIGWFAFAVTLGALGAYHATVDRLPTIQYGILMPILIGVLRFGGHRPLHGCSMPYRCHGLSACSFTGRSV
jgi:ammonia channel protein AmtB